MQTTDTTAYFTLTEVCGVGPLETGPWAIQAGASCVLLLGFAWLAASRGRVPRALGRTGIGLFLLYQVLFSAIIIDTGLDAAPNEPAFAVVASAAWALASALVLALGFHAWQNHPEAEAFEG